MEFSQPYPYKTVEGKMAFETAYDASLKLWPVKPEPLCIETRYGPTWINACGPSNAPPLMLMHAMSFTSTMWYPNVGALSKKHRVFAVDTINDLGRSVAQKPLKGRLDYVQWMKDIFDGLQISKASICGVSYGGWLTLNFALHQPDRVEKIISISPAASLARIRIQNYLKIFSTILFPVTPEIITDQFFLKGFPVQREVVVQSATGFKSGWQMTGRPVFPNVFSDNELRRIETPALLLIGESEQNYDPIKVIRRATQMMPDVKAKILPHSRHLLNIEQPETINSFIIDFLENAQLQSE